MEITLSIPTDIFEKSQKTAQNLGMSLTEFFYAALRSYISKHQFQNVIEKLINRYIYLEKDVIIFYIPTF
jgi:hypothetical protein